jgi:hypothetical protein
MKIGHEKNFWGGMLFVVIGAVFAVIARGLKLGDMVLLNGYTMGTPARMGPGFFPFYLGLILMFLGAIVLASGLRGVPNAAGKLERFHWKPILFVLGSVVGFGLLLKPLGMLVAGVLLVVGASLGSYEFKLKNTLILGVALSIFCALVFVTGLKLPIPLCPDIESLQSSIGFCRG